MVSPRAVEDLEALREEGLQPSIEDIIRLNELGLQLDSGKETTFANAPRIGFAGDVAIHQPTCQVEMWMMDIGEDLAADAESYNSIWCFACANARKPHFFDDLLSPRQVKDAIKAWYKTVTCTREELTRAFAYAVWGIGGDVVPDKTELAKESERKSMLTRRQRNFARLDAELREAREKLHLTTEEMLTMTRSRIIEMLYADAIDGGREVKRNTAKALADYLTTLRGIRARLVSEKSHV